MTDIISTIVLCALAVLGIFALCFVLLELLYKKELKNAVLVVPVADMGRSVNETIAALELFADTWHIVICTLGDGEHAAEINHKNSGAFTVATRFELGEKLVRIFEAKADAQPFAKKQPK
ncbi:MAG: hypothetical protein RR058_02595 [Oscillospiraceae bacterium]